MTLSFGLCLMGMPVYSDAELEQRIQDRLARATSLAGETFEVRVSRGVATLEGATGSIPHKAAATRIARNAGARQVVNHIRVDAASRSRSGQQMSRGRRTGR